MFIECDEHDGEDCKQNMISSVVGAIWRRCYLLQIPSGNGRYRKVAPSRETEGAVAAKWLEIGISTTPLPQCASKLKKVAVNTLEIGDSSTWLPQSGSKSRNASDLGAVYGNGFAGSPISGQFTAMGPLEVASVGFAAMDSRQSC